MINSELFYQAHIQDVLRNLDGVSYVDGWVKLHLDEMKKNSKAYQVNVDRAARFPVLASHGLEDVFTAWSPDKFTVRRTVIVSGAIDVGDKLTIDTRLQALYRRTIKAILESVMSGVGAVRDAPKFALNNSKFSIPDDDLPYAMFELTITLTTQENTKEWLN